jgi:competence protein ComEC
VDDARHFFPFLPVAFALGIAIYFVWPSEPSFHYLAVLPILLAVWRVPSLHTEAGNYNAYINSGIIFGMCLICGAGWAHLHSYHASQNWAMPPLPAGGVETTVSGQIDMSELRWRGGELHVTVRESGLSNNVSKEPRQPFRARLFSSQEIALRVQPGCHARLKVRLQPLGAPLTDGGYDPRFPAFFEGLRARGFVREIVSLSCETGTWAHRLARLRLAMAEEVRTALPARTGGVAAALITGLRGGIPPAIRETFRNSGLGLPMFWRFRVCIWRFLPAQCLRFCACCARCFPV